MVIGIWCGESKPTLREYLTPLIEEAEILLADGVSVNAHHICFKFGRVVADTPARAFLKGIHSTCCCDHTNSVKLTLIDEIIQGTVLFNHKNGCQKCIVVGVYNREFRNVSFPNINASRRTDELFRNRIQSTHHKEDSPFENLGIDMIMAFPTSDPLHLLELGVMRRCLYRWVLERKNIGINGPKRV